MHSLYSITAFILLTSALPTAKPNPKPLPLIIWHGLGDRYDAEGLQSTGDLAEEIYPGTYVYYVRTDDDGSADRTNTFFGNVTTQLAEVCEAIHNEPGLVDADDRTKVRADALGFSQGGQFLRGLIETCEGLSVRSLVTFGSQHNGIAEFQECGTFDLLCKGATGLIKGNAWTDYIQGKVVPAQYYRTVNETTGLGTDDYVEHSNFLAPINNEGKVKNTRYAEKIAALENFVMYVFDEDVTVVPKETGWFAEVNATTGEVTPLRERKMYKEDWLGLKKLDEKGGLIFKNTTGKHMELDDQDLIYAFTENFGPEREDEDVVEDWLEHPGSIEFMRALKQSALCAKAGDDNRLRSWIKEANAILSQMRAERADENFVKNPYNFLRYIEFLRMLKLGALAGEDGDEGGLDFWVYEANDMLYRIREERWASNRFDWREEALLEEDMDPSHPNFQWDHEHQHFLFNECGHDEDQAWMDSLSWWQRQKMWWEEVWSSWSRGFKGDL